MAKRKTMAESPLDMVLTEPAKKATKASKRGLSASKTAKKTPSREVQEKPKGKQRLTVHITVETIERVKNAVFWTPGLTLADLAEEALSSAVDALEKKNKKKFKQRTSELKGGRPMK